VVRLPTGCCRCAAWVLVACPPTPRRSQPTRASICAHSGQTRHGAALSGRDRGVGIGRRTCAAVLTTRRGGPQRVFREGYCGIRWHGSGHLYRQTQRNDGTGGSAWRGRVAPGDRVGCRAGNFFAVARLSPWGHFAKGALVGSLLSCRRRLVASHYAIDRVARSLIMFVMRGTETAAPGSGRSAGRIARRHGNGCLRQRLRLSGGTVMMFEPAAEGVDIAAKVHGVVAHAA
jgi:hypothetical protein